MEVSIQIQAHLAVSGFELPLWAYKCIQELWQSGDLGHQHDCCVLLLAREWNYATKSLPHCCVCCLCPDGLTQHVLPLQFQVELWIKCYLIVHTVALTKQHSITNLMKKKLVFGLL